MRGRVEARRVENERATFGAWQAERFAREDKLKPLKHYLAKTSAAPRPPATRASRSAEMLARFLNLQQAGVPMTIRRIGR